MLTKAMFRYAKLFSTKENKNKATLVEWKDNDTIILSLVSSKLEKPITLKELKTKKLTTSQDFYKIVRKINKVVTNLSWRADSTCIDYIISKIGKETYSIEYIYEEELDSSKDPEELIKDIIETVPATSFTWNLNQVSQLNLF